jgi:RNA polymerase sigma factor (sigma-70 family)
MATDQYRTFIHCLRHLVGAEAARALTDDELLDRFVSRGDEAAFEVLLWRHGPMVWSLCRRLLRQPQDVEDAFQATFLVMVRKAVAIHKRKALSSWLYKIAYRVALRARARSVSREQMERQAILRASHEPVSDAIRNDLRVVVAEAVNALPDRFRGPIVLCYFEGKTHREAARQLGCPEGTVVSRLARARERLRALLTRRGLALPGAGVAGLLGGQARAAPMPRELFELTLQAGLRYATGTAADAVSTRVVALTQGVLQSMFMAKLSTAVALFVLLGLVAVGALTLGDRSSQAAMSAAPAEDQAASDADEVRLAWRFEKDRPIFHEVTTDTKQSMKILNREAIQHDQKQTFFFRWSPTGRNGVNDWIINQRIEGIVMDSNIAGTRLHFDSTAAVSQNNPLEDSFRALVGAETELTFAATGHVEWRGWSEGSGDVEVFELIPGSGVKSTPQDEYRNKLRSTHKKVKAWYQESLTSGAGQEMLAWPFAVPPKMVKPGDTWTRTSKPSVGAVGRWEGTYRYTYCGREGRLDKIRVASEVRFSGSNRETSGLPPLPVRDTDLKTTHSAGVILFDRYKGRLVSAELNQTTEGLVTLASEGGDTRVALTQGQRISVRTTDTNPIEDRKRAGPAETEVERLRRENARLRKQLEAVEEALRKD